MVLARYSLYINRTYFKTKKIFDIIGIFLKLFPAIFIFFKRTYLAPYSSSSDNDFMLFWSYVCSLRKIYKTKILHKYINHLCSNLFFIISNKNCLESVYKYFCIYF